MNRALKVWMALAILALAAQRAWAIEFTSTINSVKVRVRPGEMVTRKFELHLAGGQQAARFHSHVEDWWQSEDGKQSFYRPPGTLAHSCGNWITLDPVETTVEPGGVLEVRITAAIPRQVAPGGYWCVLTVDELPDPLADQSAIDMRFVASVSTGIFLYVEPVVRDLRVAAVELSARQARITLRNMGNAPVAFAGRIEVLSAGGGKPVATANIPRLTVLTEPIASRVVTVALPDLGALPAGRYLTQIVLDIGLDHDIGVRKELVLPDDLKRTPDGR